MDFAQELVITEKVNQHRMTMINSLIKPLGEIEIGERVGFCLVDRNEKPKDLECKICRVTLKYEIAGEGAFRVYQPPKRCSCEKAQEYWLKYDALIDRINKECKEFENKEKRKIEVDKLVKKSDLGRRFKDRTFDTFVFNNTNKLMYDKALDYAKNFITLKEEGKGLFFTGTIGTGKTHLAVSIANYIMNEYTIPVKFGNVTSLLSEVKSSYDKGADETEAQVIYALSNVSLLIIDDLGKEKASEWSNSIIYTVINNRYENYKPLIVTTNLSIKELENAVGDATVSRLIEMCEGIKINGIDYRKSKLV